MSINIKEFSHIIPADYNGETAHPVNLQDRIATEICLVSKPLYMLSGQVESDDMFSFSQVVTYLNESGAVWAFENFPVPKAFQIGLVRFIVAKGFISGITPISPLVFTVINTEDPQTDGDLTMYISNKAFQHPWISKMLLEQIPKFRGVTIIKEDITEHFGKTFELPQFRTIQERKEFIDEIVNEALDEL